MLAHLHGCRGLCEVTVLLCGWHIALTRFRCTCYISSAYGPIAQSPHCPFLPCIINPFVTNVFCTIQLIYITIIHCIVQVTGFQLKVLIDKE